MALPASATDLDLQPVMASLEGFLVGNPDLERLEALVSRFNVFEAMGVVRHELRHSDFLAFLLDPRQTHGLGSVFAKRLLQRALQTAPSTIPTLTPIHIDLMDLDHLSVHREWRSIDIFLVDEANRLTVIIENKIDSTEHSNQLARYWDVVSQELPGSQILGLYVTPDGDLPSHDGYMPISYGVVADLVEEIGERRTAMMHPDVRILMSHYAQMLRRHIVAESEIAQLCRQIYQKHRLALDLIFEHRPDQQSAIRDVLTTLVNSADGLILDSHAKSYVRFLPQEWDVQGLRQGAGWAASGRMLLFEFDNRPQRLALQLYIGPGPEEVRQHVFDLALSAGSPFKPSYKSLGKKWNSLYQRQFLSADVIAGSEVSDLEERVRKVWQSFISADLPMLKAAIVGKLSGTGFPTVMTDEGRTATA